MQMERTYAEFAQEVTGASDALAAFRALNAIIDREVGNGLMTASVYNPSGTQSRRVYSQNEDAYPLGGLKPVAPGKWHDTVLVRREIYVSRAIEGVAEAFFDWELIRSLGFASNMNLPVIVCGRLLGTVNLLEREGFYTDECVARGRALLPLAMIAFLALAGEGRVPGD